ncbi:MAG TPA: sugar ABC transporter substrate-binding protein [Candidatus Dormibacteraeota bacterium]|nr:sugar ABC transporter substrate-binding protein [Candidatus Dormibacteraeota bacterium]
MKRFASTPFSLVAGLALVTAVACGGGSNNTGSGSGGGVPSAVTDNIAKFTGIPVWSAPGPAIDPAKLRGKKIFTIPIAETPFTQAVEAGEKQAADAAGVKVTVFPNQGDPAAWVQGMQNAIAQHPDLINLDTAPDPRALQPQIAAAKAAGIPVLVTHFYDAINPDPPACDGCAPGVTAVVKVPFTVVAQAQADWVINNSKGKADVLIVSISGLSPVPPMEQKMLDEYKNYCSGCKTKLVEVTLQQIGQAGPFSQVSSALVQDPKIDYVDPMFDALIPGSLGAVQAAGKANKIKMLSFNGSAFALQDVASGTSPVIADVAEPDAWVGYANMDQAFRVLAGMSPVSEVTPFRIFDSTNISETGGGPNFAGGYGTAYVSGFFKLWGLPAPG